MTDAPKQRKIVTYMGALYAKMSESANEVAADGSEEGVQIWQGKLIDTCLSVGIPQGYYKKVVDALRQLGCIELITRGRRGNTPTTIALRYPPSLELYEEAIVKSSWESLTRTPSADTLGAQLKDVQTRLGGIDWLAMFKNLDDRVSALEREVGISNRNKALPQDATQQQQGK